MLILLTKTEQDALCSISTVNYSLAYTLSTVMVHIIIVAMHVECWSLEIRPVLMTLTRKIADYEIAP